MNSYFYYFIPTLIIAFIIVRGFIVNSKFKVGKTVTYKWLHGQETGVIEYVGENCVTINGSYIRKEDVL